MAPEDCGEDLDTAEEEIQKFLGEKTLTHKNLTSSEEVVGLALNSPTRSAPYMTTAITICKDHGVKVYALKKPQAGLCLNGTPAAIKDMEHLLQRQVIRPIEHNIGQVQLKVKGMLKSVLSTSLFHQFSTKLQEEFCVVCTYPQSYTISRSRQTSQSNVWQWEDDQGLYQPYSSDVSKQLSNAHDQLSLSGHFFDVNQNSYSIDFTEMKQTNLVTGHQRRVRYNPIATPTTSGSVQWRYRDDCGGFSPYTPANSQSIESMHQNSSPGVLQIGFAQYTFDFARMCQINVSTGYKRPIRRDIQSLASPAAIPSRSSNAEAASPHPAHEPPPRESPAPQADILLTLRGPQDALEAAKARVERKLNSYVQKETIIVPFICTAESRSCTISGGGAGKKGVVKLEGVNTEVQATHQVASAECEQDVATHPEWEEQSRTTELFSLQQGSAEWVTVEQQFKATLRKQVASISRIQNTWLWEKYCDHKKRLHRKNGTVNEKVLFHGTSRKNPKLIYEGENGFDMRYSNQGLWGQANYFAVNASYCDNYAYQTRDGYKEMFLVKVLTGDSYQCAPVSSLRKPPEKPQSYGSGGGKVQFSKMDYDTVSGTTGGSQVYMTYDNDKAYPAYLIKYW